MLNLQALFLGERQDQPVTHPQSYKQPRKNWQQPPAERGLFGRAETSMIYSAITYRYHTQMEEKPKNESWFTALLAFKKEYIQAAGGGGGEHTSSQILTPSGLPKNNFEPCR